MNIVTLYGQPGCSPCLVAEKRFQREGIEYTKVNIQEDAEAADRLKALGFTGTPVFHHGGSDPSYRAMDGLAEIIKNHKEAA